jgi:hypothetical protein
VAVNASGTRRRIEIVEVLPFLELAREESAVVDDHAAQHPI